MTIHGIHACTLASSLIGNSPSQRSKSANIGAIARIIASISINLNLSRNARKTFTELTSFSLTFGSSYYSVHTHSTAAPDCWRISSPAPLFWLARPAGWRACERFCLSFLLFGALGTCYFSFILQCNFYQKVYFLTLLKIALQTIIFLLRVSKSPFREENRKKIRHKLRSLL